MKKVIPCNNCIYLGKERSDESAKIHGQIDEHTSFIRTGDSVKKIVLEILDKYR